MIRSKFENQLKELNKDLILMGALCDEVIAKSVEALTDENYHMINPVSKTANKIDRLERDIEGQCLKLLLRQQPVAKDLRYISAALKMVSDMKRIGAQSAEIAEIVNLGHIQAGEELKLLQKMAIYVAQMVTDSIDAFVQDNLETAKEVIEHDNNVNKYFDKMKAMLVKYFADEDGDGEHAVDVLMVAKYLERIGDHAVNVSKWVIYSITGDLDVEG